MDVMRFQTKLQGVCSEADKSRADPKALEQHRKRFKRLANVSPFGQALLQEALSFQLDGGEVADDGGRDHGSGDESGGVTLEDLKLQCRDLLKDKQRDELPWHAFCAPNAVRLSREAVKRLRVQVGGGDEAGGRGPAADADQKLSYVYLQVGGVA